MDCGMSYILIGLMGMAMEVETGRWSVTVLVASMWVLKDLNVALKEGEARMRSVRVCEGSLVLAGLVPYLL